MPIVTTWNLLHRIHAENWREPAIGAHADEALRVEALAARLLGWVAEGRIVACQEVGGDVLAALRRGLPAGASLWSFCYPRVPRLRVDGGAGPLDPSERLVTVAGPGLAGREVAAEAFATDSGKGLLVVDVAGLRVINTHVSHGERRGRQLAQLAARAGEGPAALLGDFNARRDAIAAGLGPAFVVGSPSAAGPHTRPGASHDIDHVVTRGAALRWLEVVDGGGLSDHNPVAAGVAAG